MAPRQTCPYCKGENVVAGRLDHNPDSVLWKQKVPQSIYCGYCGRTFEPALAPNQTPKKEE